MLSCILPVLRVHAGHNNVQHRSIVALGGFAHVHECQRKRCVERGCSELRSIWFERIAVHDDAHGVGVTDIEQMDVCFGSEEEIYVSFYEETSWDITTEVIEEYDDYYEETAVVAEVEEELDEAEQEEELADLGELEDDFEQEDVENLACDEALEEEIDEELDEE